MYFVETRKDPNGSGISPFEKSETNFDALFMLNSLGSKKYPFWHQLQFDSTFNFELGFNNLIKIHKFCLVYWWIEASI
jgi:hypothetical protein